MWRHLPVAQVQLLGPVWFGPFKKCQGKASFVLTLVTEAVRCDVISTHKQTNTTCSQHVVVKNEMQLLSLLLFCSWDRR